MVAQIDQLATRRKGVADQLASRARQEDLPAMTRIHQPSRLVQHPPVVVLPPLLRLARVQPMRALSGETVPQGSPSRARWAATAAATAAGAVANTA